MPASPPRPEPPASGDDSPGMAEALRRIRDARHYRSANLDLSKLRLTTLPEALRQLTALQSLYLSDNQLTTLERFGVLEREWEEAKA